MSLSRRILLVTILAIFALGAAVTAIAQVRADGSAAREQDAFERGDSVLKTLVQKVGEEHWVERFSSQTQGSPGSEFAELRGFVASLIRPISDASAGICNDSGALLLVETVAPKAFPSGEAPPPPHFPDQPGPPHFADGGRPGLLPLDRDVVIRACRAPPEETIAHVRFAAPNDLLFVAVLRVSATTSAFMLIRMPNRARDQDSRSWQVSIGALAFTTLLLVLLTLDTLRVLRRGSHSLERALVDLQHDLRADIPTPRADEFARIARRMKDMAENLAASLERERGLARRLGQEQRLISLGRVVAGVAHEVRNPLTGMKLKLDTMARRQLDARTLRDVSTCLEEIERLDRVVRSPLLIARRGPVEKSNIDLAGVVDERISAQSALMDESGVEVIRNGSAQILANREDIVRVIDNLLRNAVEASPRGAEVTILIEETSSEVRLEFVDQGEGVPANRTEELFEPFFTCKPEGTGLGLVLSRAIVEAHEGRLTYHRGEGQTRFVAVFPLTSNDSIRDAS